MSIPLRVVLGSAWLVVCACDVDLGAPEPCEQAGADQTPPTCATDPALCGLQAEHWVGAPEGRPAINVVFLGDGFTQSDLPAFRERVDALRRSVAADPDSPVGRRPGLFNLHRVDVVSRQRAVLNADPEDTPLRSCVTEDDGFLSWVIQVDKERALLAAQQHVAQPDILVVITNAMVGRANAESGLLGDGQVRKVVLKRWDDATVLTHELGHALANLEDEYTEVNRCLETSSGLPYGAEPFLDTPNLTTDPEGMRWRHKVHGAVPGGMRHACGVFHPTQRCRMHNNADPFCPVCSDALDKTLDAFTGRDDGPPLCNLALSQPPDAVDVTVQDGSLRVRGTASDRNGMASMTLRMDGLEQDVSEGDWVWTRVDVSQMTYGAHVLELECTDRKGSRTTVRRDVTRVR